MFSGFRSRERCSWHEGNPGLLETGYQILVWKGEVQRNWESGATPEITTNYQAVVQAPLCLPAPTYLYGLHWQAWWGCLVQIRPEVLVHMLKHQGHFGLPVSSAVAQTSMSLARTNGHSLSNGLGPNMASPISSGFPLLRPPLHIYRLGCLFPFHDPFPPFHLLLT